ncbi:uncharacterized protein LOC106696970 [Myotis lucifugus]|uniref:uncharacterized protein LOC106696970 n=1 Tax=Myotis lucifugus TaxID=59463 RepID=UPI000CCC44F9|nr:uncharacterized protein LOC106696970 [Myotis lucifugus]
MSEAAAAAAAGTRIWSVRLAGAEGDVRARARVPRTAEEPDRCCSPGSAELSTLNCFAPPRSQPWAASGRSGGCQVNSAPSHSSVGSTNPAAGVGFLRCHCRSTVQAQRLVPSLHPGLHHRLRGNGPLRCKRGRRGVARGLQGCFGPRFLGSPPSQVATCSSNLCSPIRSRFPQLLSSCMTKKKSVLARLVLMARIFAGDAPDEIRKDPLGKEPEPCLGIPGFLW